MNVYIIRLLTYDILNKLRSLYLNVSYLYNKFNKIKLYEYLLYFTITSQSIVCHFYISGDNNNI